MEQLDSSFFELKKFIIDFTGLSFYKDKDNELQQRINQKMNKLGISDYASLLCFLKNDKGAFALDDLISELTIGETFFFRDKETFQGLLNIILPEVIKKNQKSRQIRIWSAGCATGEEAYSISIILKREFKDLIKDWDIQIIGTDINRFFLATAIDGKYRQWSFRETNAFVIEECFDRKKEAFYIKSDYKQNVSFKYHNLVKNPIPSLFQNLICFDIVLCRNVMIYFESQTIQKLIDQLEKSLVDKGWLIVGHADHDMKHFRNFDVVNTGGAFFYQKRKDQSETFSDKDYNAVLQKPEPLFTPQSLSFSGSISINSSNSEKKSEILDSDFTVNIDELSKLANQGKWNEALLLCQNYLIKSPLNPWLYFYCGLVFEQTGKHSKAEEAFRKVIYLDRNFVLAHFHLGLLMQNTGDLRQAKKYLKNVSELVRQYDQKHIFEFADNISISQLTQIAQFHLEVLECL